MEQYLKARKRTTGFKQFALIALVVALFVTPIGYFPSSAYAEPAAQAAPGAPTQLKIELMEGAYAVDTKEPAFYWAVNDADKDEVQSAYRIVIAKRLSDVENQSYALDTGWVTSAQNTSVEVAGIENVLEDNELYYWQVQTKDKDGQAGPLSAPQSFRMALGAAGWTNTNGIWAPGAGAQDDVYYQNGWLDYTVEQDVTIAANALGLAFRMQDSTHGYFWQFRTQDISSDKNMIIPHYVNGSAASSNVKIDLTPKGITLRNNQMFKVKIQVSGNLVSTWIDDMSGSGYVLVDQNRNVYVSPFAGGGFTYGPIGYRTGGSESGYIDNVKVTAADNTVLADLTFDEGSANYFSGATLDGGRLRIPTGVSTVTRMSSAFYPNASLAKRGNFAFFRSDKISLDTNQIEKAIISMAARGTESELTQFVDLYMNGKSAGFGPARDYRNSKRPDGAAGTCTRAYYNAYDVTDSLVNGDNVIGALAVCRDATNRAALIQLDVYYKNGTKATLTNTSDGNWKALDGTDAFGDEGATISAGSYFSMPKENVNAAKYPSNWYDVGFDDSLWAAPVTKNTIVGTTRFLTPYTSENTQRVLTDEPEKNVEKKNNGNWFVDLGKEIVGSLSVNLTAANDCTVTVRMGEQLNADGSVRYQLAASPTYEETWKLKAGANVFKTATMKNFRYIELIGFDGTIAKDDIKGWAMQQSFDAADASFTSSSTLLNREYEMSKYTIKTTNQDLFVDSQARERRAYEGDLLVNSNTSYGVSDNYSLARHSNEYLFDFPTWPGDYKLFSVEMAWQDYLYTGNADSLNEKYNDIVGKLTDARVTSIRRWDEGPGLVYSADAQDSYPLIDWPEGERDGYVKDVYSAIMNSEYVGIYNAMSKIESLRGDDAQAAMYSSRAARLKANLIEKFYNAEKGAFRDSLTSALVPREHYSLHASAYALAYGIYDSQEMKEKLTNFVGNDGVFKGSIYATYFILRGLYNADGGNEAAALLLNPNATPNAKTFAAILDSLKATTSPEAWSNSHKSNLTLSHPWGSSPGCSIVQGMFGILPTKAGFEEFSVKLQPGGVESASLKTPSVKGPISVSYTNGNSSDIEMALTIPANTKAVVSLPDQGNVLFDKLKIDGVDVPAVRSGSFLSVELGSGQHTVALGEGERLGVLTAPIAGNPEILYDVKDYQLQPTITNEGSEPAPASTFGTVSYTVNDTTVLTLDANGKITPLKAGDTNIKVTLELSAHPGVKLTTTIPVKCRIARLTDMYVDMPGTLDTGDTGQAVLMGRTEAGNDIELEGAVFESYDSTLLSVAPDGQYEAKAGVADKPLIKATYTGSRKAANAFPSSKIEEGTNILLEEDFSGGNPLFGTLAVQDGALFVSAGNRDAIIYNDSNAMQWSDYTVSGKFKINATTFTIVFRASDNSHYYLWQFEGGGYLKRHINTTAIVVDGAEKVALPAEANFNPAGYNTFAIKAKGNQFTTWLNGVQIGDPLVDDTSAYSSGTIGVRTGGSESYWIDDIKIATDSYSASKEIAINGGGEIISQPVSQWVGEGTSATFSVSASGHPVTYQWQTQKAGAWIDIADAVEATYTVSGLKLNDNGTKYRCAVTINGTTKYSDEAGVGVLQVMPSAAEIASGIDHVSNLTEGQTQINMPGVPNGYSIVIKQSSNPSVIDLNGSVTPAYSEREVDLVFEITKQLDGSTALTVPVKVIVPALSTVPPATAEELADALTDSLSGAHSPGLTVTHDATEFPMPVVPDDFDIFIASVNPSGVIRADGSVTPPLADTDVRVVFLIVDTSNDTSAYTAPITVKVEGKTLFPLEGIALNVNHLILKKGDQGQFVVSRFPVNTTDIASVSYSVAPSGIISVKPDGSYTALKSGSAVITAASSIGGYKSFCAVIVQEETGNQLLTAVQSISITPKSAEINVGSSVKMKANVLPAAAAAAYPTTWASSDPKVAMVSADGTVYGISEGAATITASAGGKKSVSAVVVAKPVTSILMPLKSIYLKKNAKLALPFAVYDEKGGISAVTKWSSSNPSVVSVDSATGRVTAKKVGKAKITATSLNGKKAFVTVNVVKKSKSISKISFSKPPKVLKTGATANLILKISPAKATFKTLVFKSSKPGILRVDKAGKLTALKKGKAVITVKMGNKVIKTTVRVK